MTVALGTQIGRDAPLAAWTTQVSMLCAAVLALVAVIALTAWDRAKGRRPDLWEDVERAAPDARKAGTGCV